MKMQWRQHEITLVTLIGVTLLLSYLWNISHLSQEMISLSYSDPFKNKHSSFSLFKNVILPEAGSGILIYMTYLWINTTIIKSVLNNPGPPAKNFLFHLFKSLKNRKTIGRFIVVILTLTVAFTIANFLKNEWQFYYNDSFNVVIYNNLVSQLKIGVIFFTICLLSVLFIIYVVLREYIIQLIEAAAQPSYYVLICNNVTSFILIFTSLIIFLKSFRIIDNQQYFALFCIYIPILFAVYMVNVYWIFPLKGAKSVFKKEIIIRLLFSSFIFSIPLSITLPKSQILVFLYSWLIQLFIIAPLTWSYYRLKKEKVLALKVMKEELVKSKTDLQFLRSQINPHFLFNTLNTLYGTALHEKAATTAESIQKLGDMMRFMLYENNLDFIHMPKEIEYLKNYIDLQKARTISSPNVIIEDNVNECNCNFKIAPMLLIPLVENAFKHGTSLKEKSWVKINLKCDKKGVFFEVRNSVHEKPATGIESNDSGIGYKNVVERLKILYRNKHQIVVKEDGAEYIVKLFIECQ